AVRKLAEHIVDQTSRSNKKRDLDSCPTAPTNALTLNMLFPMRATGIRMGSPGGQLNRLLHHASVLHITITKEPLPFTHERIVRVTGTPCGLQTATKAILQAAGDTLGKLQSEATLYRPVRYGLRNFLRRKWDAGREPARKRARSMADASDRQDRRTPDDRDDRDDRGKRPRRMSDHSDARSASSGSRPWSAGSRSRESGWEERRHGRDDAVEKIVVSNEVAGWLIGRNGCRIAKVMRRSGADIRLSPRVMCMDDRIVTITGSPYKVKDARRLVERNIRAFESGDTSD
ncbi:hypothetical protein GGI15_001123, partial [Coemansia interrupta]